MNGGERLKNLVEEPRDFFMTLRDIAFWVRSARSDAALNRLLADRTAGEAFDHLYATAGDPYASTLPQYRYQRRKYRALLSMLPNRHYGRVLDVGCGLGVFTRALAPYAERVTGIDVSTEATAQARSLSRDFNNVDFEHADLENFHSADRFSLVVVADVVYYLAPPLEEAARRTAATVAALLEPGGLLLLVNHYFFGIDPASRSTRRIHDAFAANSNLRSAGERRRAFYLATLFERI